MDAKHLPEAISELGEAVRISPGYLEAQENLALALRQAGRVAEAEIHSRIAGSLRAGAPGH